MQSLVECLAALSHLATLGLRVKWIKTKIHNFLQAVDQVSAVILCGEAVDVVKVCSYLGRTEDNSGWLIG